MPLSASWGYARCPAGAGFAFLGLLLLGAACGKIPVAGDDDDLADGGPGVDAPPATGTAQVTALFDDGTPVSGAVTVVTDQNGNQTTSVLTQADGTATFEVTAGDTVHIGWMDNGTPPSRRLFTIMGIEPEDHVQLVHPGGSIANQGTVVAQFTSGVMGATTYEVTSGCDRNTFTTAPTSVTLSIDERCMSQTNQVTIVATARGALGNILGQSVVRDTAFAPPTMAVTMPSWQLGTVMAFRADVLSVPPGAIAQTEITTRRYLSQFENLERILPPGSSGTHDAQFASGYAAQVQAVAFAAFGDGTVTDGVLFRGRKVAASMAQATLDFATGLPRILGVTWASDTVGVHAFMWQLEGVQSQLDNAGNADAMLVVFNWRNAVGDPPNQWRILVPPSNVNGELYFTLNELAAMGPPIGPIPLAQTTIVIIEADVFPDYTYVKNQFGPDFLEDSIDLFDDFNVALSVSGAGLN